MSVVTVVELLAESDESWEDATRKAVEEATKILRGIRSVYIKEFQALVENDKVKTFRVNAKGLIRTRKRRRRQLTDVPALMP